MNAPSGKILLYRVFDIGMDIDLESLQRKIASATAPQRFRLAKSSRAMIINNAPLSLTLETGTHRILGITLEYEITSKIWHFGAISTAFHIAVPKDLEWNRLIELGAALENDHSLHELAVQRTTQIIQQFDPSRIPGLNLETYEDYIIYFFRGLPGCESGALSALQVYDVARLILSETSEALSDQVKKAVADGAIQYGQNDLALINWNSAFIIEPTGIMDIPDTIEFALCQLLEMRYYDDLLDDKLASLYDALERKRLSVWETYSEKLSKEAAQRYLEISETVESVQNSLKVVGDFYLAQVFRTALTRFRFNDWRESVNQKLDNLAEISKLINSHINERRNQILEIIIIVLIAIEVVPFVYSLLKAA